MSKVQNKPVEASSSSNNLKILKDAFPDIDIDTLETILAGQHGQVEPAFEILLSMSDPGPSKLSDSTQKDRSKKDLPFQGAKNKLKNFYHHLVDENKTAKHHGGLAETAYLGNLSILDNSERLTHTSAHYPKGGIVEATNPVIPVGPLTNEQIMSDEEYALKLAREDAIRIEQSK